MMSLEAIRSMSQDAARNAAKRNQVPFTVEAEDIADLKQSHRMPFPFLGDYVPKGWERTAREPMFVDSSGFGQDDEPAMSVNQFLDSLIPGMGYAVIQTGQFQVYVAEYQRTKTVNTWANVYKPSQLDQMMAWEDGSLDEDGTIALFQDLVNSGLAWQLQGMYGRQAMRLIQAGLVHREVR